MKQMKSKAFCKILALLFFTLFAVSCNETLDDIGFSILPEEDRIHVNVDTLDLRASTVQVDSIFSRVWYPVLGEYMDPVFGSIKSDYVGEFYFPEGSGFHDGASIDSVRVQLSYMTMMGDSLSPMSLSVYELTKSLKGVSNYSHTDPKKYADMSAPKGTQTFTGRNSTYRTETTASGGYVKVYEINVMLPKALGEKFLAEYNKEGHGKLVNPDTFREFFPGLYFTTTFGKSTILNITSSSLMVHYQYMDKNGSSTKEDTIRTSALNLYITPEVTQFTHIENKNDQLLVENDDHTFVKSPAGVITRITFPFSQPKVGEKLKSQTLNLANLTVYALPEPNEETMIKLTPPSHLLLVNKDSLAGFFENKKLPDNTTGFLSGKFDQQTYSYSFGNISSMVNHYKEKHQGQPFDLDYYLIPVDVTFASDQYGNMTNNPLSVQNKMWPSAVRLNKREGRLKINLIFSNL